jgi:hypothetical protein
LALAFNKIIRHSGAARSVESDCVRRIANANAAGGSQSERQGWRESIHFDLINGMDSRLRGNDEKRVQ